MLYNLSSNAKKNLSIPIKKHGEKGSIVIERATKKTYNWYDAGFNEDRQKGAVREEYSHLRIRKRETINKKDKVSNSSSIFRSSLWTS